MLYRAPAVRVKQVLMLSCRQLSSSNWTKSQGAAFAATVLHGECELMDATQAPLSQTLSALPAHARAPRRTRSRCAHDAAYVAENLLAVLTGKIESGIVRERALLISEPSLERGTHAAEERSKQ
jgi:hypothetical protein